VFFAKAAVQALFSAFGLSATHFQQPENRGEIPHFLHRGQASWVQSNGDAVGYLGSLHPGLLDEHKVRVPTAIFELSFRPFLQAKPLFQHYRPFSRFPAVRRDLALVMPMKLATSDVVDEIKRCGDKILQSAEVFDNYTDPSLGKGLRSVAIRMSFQDPDGTLQDQVVQEKIAHILDSLKKKWGLTPR